MFGPKQQVMILVLLYIVAAWWPFRLEFPRIYPNGAVIDKQGVLFESPGLLYADAHPLVHTFLDKPDATFLVELRIRPATLDQIGPARILEIGQDHKHMDLMVGQSGDAIVARVRRRGSNAAGMPPLIAREVLAVDRTTHIVVTVRPDRIELYINGKLVDSRDTAKPADTWSEDAALTVGDSPVGERAWLGRLETGRLELNGVEILDLVQNASNMRPARILHIPEHLREVLGNGWLPPYNVIDVCVNLLGFIPLGFLGARAWQRRPLRAGLLLSLSTSATMELGQIVLATRWPSLLDLITNLSGGGLGAFLFVWASRRIERNTDK